MADRLVDLQRQLLGAEDQRRLPARAQRRRQQRPRLLGDPCRVGVEVELLDELPAARAVLAPRRRIRAALGLAVADRRGHDPGAALAHPLVDAVALAGDEPLGRVPDLVQPLGEVGTVLTHRRRRPHQQVALVRQCDAERIDLALAGPRPGRHLTGDELRGRRARPWRWPWRSPWPVHRRRAPRRRTRSGTAKNPHPDPTSARTPIPASSCWMSSSTSPLRAVIDSCRRCITRASA